MPENPNTASAGASGEIPKETPEIELAELAIEIKELRDAVQSLTLELEHVRHRLDDLEHKSASPE